MDPCCACTSKTVGLGDGMLDGGITVDGAAEDSMTDDDGAAEVSTTNDDGAADGRTTDDGAADDPSSALAVWISKYNKEMT